MSHRIRAVLCGVAAALLAPAAVSATPEGIAYFEQHVRPVLVEHCYECHSTQSAKLKANLLLDTRAGWQKGGDSGVPAIVPGHPDESPLIRAIRHDDEDLAMPPRGPRLPETVLAALVEWVRRGAPDPRDGSTVPARRADRTWWSLQPLAAERPHDSIDALVDASLAERKLTRNPPADPRTLIRRMSHDVTGLPPTAAEVAAFVAAHRADPESATAALADRLLASPRYGERWGRHWLDVIRFGESNGFERNSLIDDLWPFRDWVIRSLNADRPFDRLIVEHLAGDVLAPDDPDVAIGSAFLVAGPYDDVANQDPAAQAAIRAATLDDMIIATSGAFLGLTVGCARCHHHKFDPIPTEDYYRLRAAFEGVQHGRRTVATKEQRAQVAAATREPSAALKQLTAEAAAIEEAIRERSLLRLAGRTYPRPKVDPEFTEETFAPVGARQVRFVVRDNTDLPGRAPRLPDATGTRGGGRLTEFEVWSTDGRNVALAAQGARAEGARGTVADDFPEAYGPQLCIDGKLGEQWFIGEPAQLTITLANAETIDRITFRNSKGEGMPDGNAQGVTPCEYEVQVSPDGKAWRTVADSRDREPWSERHALERIRPEVVTTAEAARLAALAAERARLQAVLNAVPKLPQVWAGIFRQPREQTYVHKGGDPQKPGAPVPPGSLEVLSALAPAYALPADAPEGERRLALGRWITSAGQPLAARVLANRVWQHHFGTGIVDTPNDFGFLGGAPSHPELLDFLARRLLHHGWRLKPLQREILLSQAYRQSSDHRPAAAAIDQESRLLWRFPPRRLGAEEIRDAMLFVSGQLRLEPMGGPGFRLYRATQNNVSTYFPLDVHGPETFRRAVYHQTVRASVVDLLSDFDLPDVSAPAPRRSQTTSPLQALTLLNHRFTLDVAAALAARCAGPDPVGTAYALVLQRTPTAAERSRAGELQEAHGLQALCRALLNTSEFLYVD